MFLFTLPSFHSKNAGSWRTKPNFFSCTIWKTSLCFTDQKTQEKNLLSGTNSFSCRSVLTPIACKKFKIHSPHADSPRAQSNLFACTISQTSPCFIDQETQEENLLGGTNSFVGQFLHPSLAVQSSRSIPHIQTVQRPKLISSLVQYGRPVFVSQIKKLRKRIYWVEPTPS